MCDFSQYGGATEELLAAVAGTPDLPKLSINELKALVNGGREDSASDEMKTVASQVTLKDHAIIARDGFAIEARTYRPASVPASQELPIYIHFHGGGFLFGTLASEDATCSRITLATGVMVLNVNYRHTPEYVYPTAWEDAEDAFDWVYEHAGSVGGRSDLIVIGGISAGGHLTASLVQTKLHAKAPSYKSIKGQVLMIPALAHKDCYEPLLKRMKDPSISSYIENEFAPILPLERLNMFCDLLYCSALPNPSDRRANPGIASPEEVKGLPPTVFGIAGLDVLRDEGLLYAQLLAENGVPTDVHVFKGLPHGFRRYGEKLKTASAAWDKVIYDGIRWALSNPPASIEIDVHAH